MTKYIIGCSYVDQTPRNFFDNFCYVGMSGCDNATILNTVIHLNQQQNIEYVFVLFTGLLRTSYSVSKNLAHLYEYYDYTKINDDELRIFSGGNFGSWTVNKSLSQLFKLSYYDENLEHIKQNSLISCISCVNFLKVNSIPFNYSFAYNPINPNFYDVPNWGSVDKNNYYWNLLDKEYFIDKCFLYDYARETNLLSKDNYHPSLKAYYDWYHIIKDKLTL